MEQWGWDRDGDRDRGGKGCSWDLILKMQWRVAMEDFPSGFWIWEQPEITVFLPPPLPDWIFGPNPDDNSNKSDVNCITNSVNEMSEMPEVPRHRDRQPQDVVIAIGETCHLPQQT